MKPTLMIVLFWNARGLAHPDSRLVLKKFCFSNKPEVLIISEPWTDLLKISLSYWRSFNLKPFAVNSNCPPNIWCLSYTLESNSNSSSSQQVSFYLDWKGQSLFMAAIYTSTSYIKRRVLWQELAGVKLCSWCFIGDFNSIVGAQEKHNCCPPATLSCGEFKAWSSSRDLFHINVNL